MPIYEYRCENGHTFEVMRRMTDPPVTTCEVHGVPVERVFNPIAVHFKGSGFYSTDYGSKKRSRELKESNEAESKSKDAKTDAGSSSLKSDSKSDSAPAPAAKSETKSSSSD